MTEKQQIRKPRVEISEEAFQEWKESPVTKRVLEVLEQEGQYRRNVLQTGVTGLNSTEIGERYVRILTQAEVYESVKNITIEDINYDDDEEDV